MKQLKSTQFQYLDQIILFVNACVKSGAIKPEDVVGIIPMPKSYGNGQDFCVIYWQEEEVNNG